MIGKMLKNLALVAGSVAALGVIRSKAKQQQADQQLWSQATDSVAPAGPGTPAGGGSPVTTSTPGTTALGNPPA